MTTAHLLCSQKQIQEDTIETSNFLILLTNYKSTNAHNYGDQVKHNTVIDGKILNKGKMESRARTELLESEHKKSVNTYSS